MIRDHDLATQTTGGENAAAFYVRQIEKHCPSLEIDSVMFNDDGQYNDVLIVNGSLVFRFAIVPAAVETLRQEIAILKAIPERITLAIPNPIYQNVETDAIGEAFMGYRMIRGQPFWRKNFDTISESQTCERLAAQLAGFLHELHRLPAHEIVPVALPVSETRAKWTELYDRIRAKLFVYMRPDARRQVANRFEEYLDASEPHEYEPCLRHGDFGSGNIIYDPVRRTIAGVIDFGATALGDPAVDYAGLYVSYGEEFYERCCAFYPEMARALPRVHFACSTFALQEALFGIENGDEEAFRAGIADYL